MSRAVFRTPLLLATGLVGLVVVLALGMYVYDHTRRDQIAEGVEIDGVGVGGMSSSAARAKLERHVRASMEGPIRVERDGRVWTLLPRQTGVAVDVPGSVDQAVLASREGSIFTRTWRGISGGAVRRDLPLSVAYSHTRLREFVARVKQAVDRPAKDATVQASAAGLTAVPDQVGLSVFRTRLEHRLAHALTSVGASRTVSVPVHVVKPAVTTGELAAKYPAYIVVNRDSFQLRYYSHLKLASTFPIAVGMQGLETPPGLYHIQWKQVNPPWYVPNSAWAGKLAGKTIPPGPEDPLKARFMSFDGGAGIHGIDPSEYGSIGHDASHGCVRMRIPDVIALYARTPVGTPVYIV